MKKVVLCIPTLGIGGAERFVADLATNMDRASFDVIVAITRQNTSTYLKDVLEKHGIRIVDLSGPNYLSMLVKQLAFLRKEKPDVVHTNIGSILHMMMATKLVPVPIKLFTLHNQAEYILNQRKINRWLYQKAFSFFGYIPVAICENVAQSLMGAFGLSGEQIRVVNNGIDISKFYPLQNNQHTDSVRIITTGTMYPIKNHMGLIEIFGQLYKKHPHVTLTILGDGELRHALEEKIGQLGLAEAVHLPGIQQNVCVYLQNADLYVSASKSEGLPLSILEAMACGLPVVATDVGGTVDIVKNGISGIVVPKDNKKALEDALESLIENDRLRMQYGMASRQIAQDWSLEACVKGYEKLYLAEV